MTPKSRVLGTLFDLPGRGRKVTRASRLPAPSTSGGITDSIPTVSVVVPCYNYGHFLDDCINSLVSQDGVNVDVMIIDDMSPDGSGEVADRLAAQHRQVSSVRHEVNRGHIATYNEGLDRATGDYVVLLDADDVIAPGAFNRATQLMEANPAVGMVYGHPASFTDSIPTESVEPTRSWTVWQGHEWVRAQCRRGLSIVFSPEVVMRTSVQREVGGFRPELPHSADLECWLRIAAIADIGRVNGPDQAYRRVHGQSMMHTGWGTVLADLKGRLDGYESFFDTAAGGISNAAELRTLVHRNTAAEALGYACGLLAESHAGPGTGGESEAQAETVGDSAGSAAEYLTFASSIYSDVVSLPEWHEYQLLKTRSSRSATGRLQLARLRTSRELRSKYAWQRWYWQGT